MRRGRSPCGRKALAHTGYYAQPVSPGNCCIEIYALYGFQTVLRACIVLLGPFISFPSVRRKYASIIFLWYTIRVRHFLLLSLMTRRHMVPFGNITASSIAPLVNGYSVKPVRIHFNDKTSGFDSYSLLIVLVGYWVIEMLILNMECKVLENVK